MPARFDENGRLPIGEIEAVNVQAVYVVGLGWNLRIGARRQFQGWDEASRGEYQMLTTPELLSVIDSALAVELEL
jgi:hypothetical protein